MKVWIKRVVWVLALALVVIQVFRPTRTNPMIDPKNEISTNLTVPPDVTGILARSCNDCHSNRTTWPWYSSVAPVSWLVAYDVNYGRGALNFSEWGMRDPEKNGEMLGEICKEVTEKKMPGLIYPIMHSGAKLTEADVQTVCRWTQSVQPGHQLGESANPSASR